MKHVHAEFVEGCFACKLKTLNFGVVPGAAQQASGRYYDSESIEQTFGGPEEEAKVMEMTGGVGPLKPDWGPWKKDGTREGILYKRDRRGGGYAEADIKDVDKVLGLDERS